MSTDTQLIQLSSLLTRAILLLSDAHTSKVFANKSLLTPEVAKKPLTEATREWLISKNTADIKSIDELTCAAGKLLFNECTATELVENISVREQHILKMVMSDQKIFNKLSEIYEKREALEKPLEIVDGKVV